MNGYDNLPNKSKNMSVKYVHMHIASHPIITTSYTNSAPFNMICEEEMNQ